MGALALYLGHVESPVTSHNKPPTVQWDYQFQVPTPCCAQGSIFVQPQGVWYAGCLETVAVQALGSKHKSPTIHSCDRKFILSGHKWVDTLSLAGQPCRVQQCSLDSMGRVLVKAAILTEPRGTSGAALISKTSPNGGSCSSVAGSGR